jgi:hypothetical protein
VGRDESMAQVVVDPVQVRRKALCDGVCSDRAEAGVGRYAGVQRASAACKCSVQCAGRQSRMGREAG